MTASQFIWYELMTHDTAAASAFYGKVFGWTAAPAPMGKAGYEIVSAGTVGVAGIVALRDAVVPGCVRSSWLGYVATADVDGVASRVEAAGGHVLVSRTEIPGIGHFASLADPQGVPFVVMRPVSTEPPPEVAPYTHGHFGWRELHAVDGTASFGFYSDLFGWSPASVDGVSAIEMGPLGVYRMFGAGAEARGGIMTKMPDTADPFWAFYVNVDTLGAAVARAREAGGTVVTEDHKVPGGNWIAHVVDPQGAFFGMTSRAR